MESVVSPLLPGSSPVVLFKSFRKSPKPFPVAIGLAFFPLPTIFVAALEVAGNPISDVVAYLAVYGSAS
jgi:hypothetical protein